ncbi:hypothetical protein ACLB1R_32460 [Escherichia coli]
MAELTAVEYIQFWYPGELNLVSAAVFFVVINAINLTNVKVFGEMEFWFAIIKVIAVELSLSSAAGCCSVVTAVRRQALATCGIRAVSCRTASPGW